MLTQPQQPVLSAKTLPGAEHWKMPLLLFTERKKYMVQLQGLSGQYEFVMAWTELGEDKVKPFIM